MILHTRILLLGIILSLLSLNAGFAQGNQLENAAQKAKQENKHIFMNFSGSDWCRSCILLKKTILDTPKFIDFAKKELILVDVDFPRKKKNLLDKVQTEYNEKLAAQYNPDGQFPTIIILDSDLNILAKTGYKRLSPEKYIEHIKTLIKQ